MRVLMRVYLTSASKKAEVVRSVEPRTIGTSSEGARWERNTSRSTSRIFEIGRSHGTTCFLITRRHSRSVALGHSNMEQSGAYERKRSPSPSSNTA